MTKKLPGRAFDAQDFLTTPEDRAGMLAAVAELGDADAFRAMLLHVAKAEGMAEMARRTGLGEKTLFRSLGKSGNPTLDTIDKVLHAVGLRLNVSPM